MKCSPLQFDELIQDEQGNQFAPLVSYDVDGQMWHIVGTETDFVVMVPNMIDAGIYRWHRAHEDMPSAIAAQLVTTNSSIVPPKKANELAMMKIKKAKEPKAVSGGKKAPEDPKSGPMITPPKSASDGAGGMPHDTGEENKNQRSEPSPEDGKS